MTILDICEKNLSELTDDELEKVLNGWCENLDGSSTTTAAPANTPDTPTPILVYYPILSIAGVALNLMVIITIFSRYRLRTVTNAFMISLSIADFLMATVVIPLRLNEWLGSVGGNHAVTDMLFPLIGVASIFSLCSVTLDRYIHIRNALNYEKYMNKIRATVVVTSIWVFSTLQALVVFFMDTTAKEMIYNDVRLVMCFCLPAIFIAVAYAKLFAVARNHARVIATTAAFPHNRLSVHRKDFKILKVVALIVGAFFVCWFPFFVLISYELHTGLHSRTFRIFMNISECLACSTCVFNPLLYGFLRRDLRLSIKNVAACKHETIDEVTGS